MKKKKILTITSGNPNVEFNCATQYWREKKPKIPKKKFGAPNGWEKTVNLLK